MMSQEKPSTAELLCRNEKCRRPVRFDFETIGEERGIRCPACGRVERLDERTAERLGLLRELLSAIRRAGPILGRSRLVLESEAGRAEIPFNLLLHRLTTDFALDFGDEDLAIRIAVNPLAGEERRPETGLPEK